MRCAGILAYGIQGANNPSNMEVPIVRLKLLTGDLTVINVYPCPSSNIPDDVISDYRKLLQVYNCSAIILGDFNAYSTLFSADSTDDYGQLLEELIEEHNLIILNTGAGTFIRPSGELSHIDIAMASANVSRIANWTVLDDKLGSDHLLIVITISNPAVVEESSQPHWMYRKADRKGFKDDCKRLFTEDIITDDVTTSCNHVVSAIVQAADKNVLVSKPSINPTRKLDPYNQRTKQVEEQVAADT